MRNPERPDGAPELRRAPRARYWLAIAALVALVSGLLAGCGAGVRVSRTADRTQATATQPVVTTVSASTTAKPSPHAGAPTIIVGDGNWPEQFIIGQLYRLALEQQGYTVRLSTNIGEPAVRLTGLSTGSLDVYPEYLNAWDSSVAGLSRGFASTRAAFAAGKRYARRQGLVLLKPTPFSDTSALAVTSEYARLNHLHSIADLRHGPKLALGWPTTFQASSAASLPELEEAYHLRPFVRGMTAGAQYGRLDSGDIQVAWANTTDPELTGPKYRLLTDPKHVFGFGNVVPVTTPAVLRAEGPAFRRTRNRVDALLTLRAVRGLNAEYLLGRPPEEIARQFLEGNGVLPPARYAPVPSTTTVTTQTATNAFHSNTTVFGSG